MSSSFLTRNGFFVCWQTKNSGECRIFNQSKKAIDVLFSKIKQEQPSAEKYRIKNGVMKKIA